MGVLAAERIKLTSTRSPVWCTVLMVVAVLGMALLFGLLLKLGVDQFNKDVEAGKADPADIPYPTNSIASLGITGLASGFPGFGYILVMIVAALAVTSEYRFGTIKATFLALPNRASVLVAKAGLISVAAAVLSAVLTLLSFLIFKGVTGSDAGRELSLADGDNKVFYAVPLFIVLVVFLSIGVGALLRQSAGALAVLIVWPVLIEPIVGFFGERGEQVQVLLPFQNAGRFLDTVRTDLPWHWGPWGGLAYFAVFVALVFGAALFVVNRRDA
ncbi:ABC transporter permease [Nocardia bovistercoris]|uniref:ABC transporter permease n=1 Tax=Nocardia bovistercoris TaxID=2785916 RepID=A0A931IDK6_9NOCA|nr:ABC transporter permease [Nocardia bovistercoris]MBH0778157.1 ABC transporter permease [Nocardia bovistercoris]